MRVSEPPETTRALLVEPDHADAAQIRDRPALDEQLTIAEVHGAFAIVRIGAVNKHVIRAGAEAHERAVDAPARRDCGRGRRRRTIRRCRRRRTPRGSASPPMFRKVAVVARCWDLVAEVDAGHGVAVAAGQHIEHALRADAVRAGVVAAVRRSGRTRLRRRRTFRCPTSAHCRRLMTGVGSAVKPSVRSTFAAIPPLHAVSGIGRHQLAQAHRPRKRLAGCESGSSGSGDGAPPLRPASHH